MCGRYVSPEEQDIEQFWNVRAENPFTRSFNVAPTMQVPIVYIDRHGGGRKIALARWGLVPFWAKGSKLPSHSFNTRLEDAPFKPMWRQPFRSARCIVPAAGWYEWKALDRIDQAAGEVRKYKQPYFMHLRDRRPIGFAGLMSWTKAEGTEDWTGSCSILTTAASGIAASVHHRMPVALAESAHDAWLDRALVDPDQVAALIAGNSLASDIVTHQVSTRVNASRADDPLLLDPVNPD